ncbi:MAG: outer membrane lipoprotein-sorting protein [Candidatus Poribacteria bacterium]
MNLLKKLTYFSIDHPKTVIFIILVITMIFMAQFVRIKIDTDPENMLETDQPDRVFYDRVKKDFGINDLIVLGITDEGGIFRPETLRKIQRITDEILKIEGVIAEDVMSFTTTNNVTAEGGLLTVERIMDESPTSPEEIAPLRQAIYDNPMFVEQLVSKDGKGIAIYVPIQQKDMSHRISKDIEAIVAKELGEGQKYYLAGLPVAEDTFGFEMFMQMGITAPIAMMVIFLLMFLIFRKLTLIISPMIVAMFSVMWGMGLLIGLGYTVHIMSSMIPIFLMPIAVLDSVHILSEFHDRYPALRDKKGAMRAAMDELFTPMLYTSLTTAVGFGSLMLAPIPPVQVFGAFVAFGVLAAWLLTVTLAPACTMLIREEKLETRLAAHEEKRTLLARLLPPLGSFAHYRSKPVILSSALILAVGVWGLTRIVVNDNPVKWFKPNHRLRIADREMNKIIGGTYMAYLVVEGSQADDIKRPEVMAYIEKLQNHLESQEIVGKTSSVADIVKRINYVLHDENKAADIVPTVQDEIGQYLFLFQMSGDPDDLDNFVDNDYRNANIWVQLRRGDNKEMENVIASVNTFTQQNPPPSGIKLGWSGLTYINKVWQDLMVGGMLKAVLGGFVAVFVLMVILFRSPLLAFISMMPLTFAIILTYGILGFVGKDYDMPVAVCSSLALGLSIDYAIHFCQRFKGKCAILKDVERTNAAIFEEPARAIARNAIVIIFGFLPLVFATLTPYMTVGIFFATLMGFSGLTTLILLPALMRIFGGWIFRKQIAGAPAKAVASLLLLFLGFFAVPNALAQTPTADEIMRKSHEAFFYAGDDMKAKVNMRLISKDGKERIRDLAMLRKDLGSAGDTGDQKYFMYFENPNDVRGMTFLVWKYPAKDDDRWIYIPAIKMVRRIAAKDQQSSFVGSDFTYEDVSGRNLTADTYSLVREETFNGKDCYVIKSVPKNKKSAKYREKLSWIDKKTFLPLKEEYTDKRGQLYKVFTADEVKEIDNIPTIMKRTMENKQNGHRTEVTFTEVKYNLGLPQNLFSERSLRRAPMQWIR